MINNHLAAVVPTVLPMQDMSTGAQVANASIGFMLLMAGFFLTRSAISEKREAVFPYSLDQSTIVENAQAKPEIHRLLALISFVIFGWAGATLVMSGPGFLGDSAKWIQDLVNSLGDEKLLADAGAPGISLSLLLLALSTKTNYMVDYIFGVLAGIIWPLGGGVWLESSRAVGQLGVQIYEWLEDGANWVANLNPVAIIIFILTCLVMSWAWRNHFRGKVQEKISR